MIIKLAFIPNLIGLSRGLATPNMAKEKQMPLGRGAAIGTIAGAGLGGAAGVLKGMPRESLLALIAGGALAGALEGSLVIGSTRLGRYAAKGPHKKEKKS